LAVSAPSDTLENLVRPAAGNTNVDRKVLADLLMAVARTMKPDVGAVSAELPGLDPRLEQLRTVLLGREIESLSRLEDPEQFAAAVGRVLPVAVARASPGTQLGEALAPALEKAAQSSIRSNPGALLNILHPLIVPAISKSIGETIDKTFQSLNETLKASLTWRGLRWRLEAWRSGKPFAEIVLRHTLVYQVEHAFLIHRHTGLLIAHAAAENAASQDPQIVSSMLQAIQDFVRDSFSGAGQQGLDTLRLGDLRLWSEPGPYATLVAVIRGNPPEDLHGLLAETLSRIHVEYATALERFDGDITGLEGTETALTACVTQGQRAAPRRTGFPWLVALIALAILLALAGWLGYRWLGERRFAGYLAELQAQPGIVLTQTGRQDGKFLVAGLRDPLAVAPETLLHRSGMDSEQVDFRWMPYQALDVPIVLKRLRDTLVPPPSVSLEAKGNQIVATGDASQSWLQKARDVAGMLPAGAPAFDLSGVQDKNADLERRWKIYLAELRNQPGIVITERGQDDGKFSVGGLRDPLAADPLEMLRWNSIDPSIVTSHWAAYESLDRSIVQKRLMASLTPPPSVALMVEGDNIVAIGSAPSLWLERARLAARMLPSGSPELDLTQVRDVTNEEIGRLRTTIEASTIRFDTNEMLPAPGQDEELDNLAKELKRFTALAEAWHFKVQVMLTGHADLL